jgi:hypothetical protein
VAKSGKAAGREVGAIISITFPSANVRSSLRPRTHGVAWGLGQTSNTSSGGVKVESIENSMVDVTGLPNTFHRTKYDAELLLA